MLGLKNQFAAKPTTSTEPPVPSKPVSVEDAEKKLFGADMTWRRAKVALAESQSSLTPLQRALGEKEEDGEDTGPSSRAVEAAELTIKKHERAVTVALLRKQEADAVVTQAKRLVAIEAEDEAVAAAKASALKLEALLCGEVKLAVDEFAADLTAVKDRCGSDTGVASSLNNTRGWFPVYRDRACASLVPSGRAYSRVLHKEKKTFSAWVDDVAYAVAYRRKDH
jgi:hypothetical protein